MTESDKKWLKNLQAKSWVKHPPQYSGGRQTSYGHMEDLPISEDDRKKVINFFWYYKDQIIFEPGSGVFGFGVCIAAYLHEPGSYPGVPDELDHLVTVTSKQMFPDSRGGDQKEAYELFGNFTHTEKNKKARKAAGLKEEIKDWSYYDY